MSQDSSVSSLSAMKWQCGIAMRIFTAFTPTNAGRHFYKCSKPNGYKCDYWKWVDDPLHPRVSNLIHNLKKENDNFIYLASEIEENCERLDEIIAPKSEEVVVDNEDAVVDKSKKKVYKMWIMIAMLCFAAFWVMK
ncbi:hypothetical protein R3W88_029971 [Solanum pinnatisectum]|uniref:GRF-type domain-containing protein n=1 Tax=Solanum pinnatisectum TaxID=50273 RepID=A0AAV9K6V3_9SOLN|nr:hypothetical protein R3W88_029971 [Solanum pinnatisectum]